MAESTTSAPVPIQPNLDDRSEFAELWQNAIKVYGSTTGRDLLGDPLYTKLQVCVSVDDVVSVLDLRGAGFEEFRKSGHKFWATMKFIGRMLSIVVGTSGEAAAAASAPVGKAVFVAVGRLLQATKGVSEAYDATEKAFSKLEYFFDRLETHLQSSTPITAQLRSIFVKILVEVIKFVGFLTKYIDDTVAKRNPGRLRKAISRTFRRTKDLGSALLDRKEVKEILDTFRELTTEELLRVAAETHVAVSAIGKDVSAVQGDVRGVAASLAGVQHDTRQNASQANMLMNDQADRNIRVWLNSPDPSLNHDHVRKARESGTCDWIFGAKFQEWRAQPNGVCWLHGNPGSGKSVLCSSIIEKLISEKETIVYFYFDFRDPGKQTTVGLLTSLIYQLFTCSTSCRALLRDFYARNKHNLNPREEMLMDCLIEMLHCCEKVFVVLDALDECPMNTRGLYLLPLLDSLIGRNIKGLRLLMTSRLERDIRTAFHSRFIILHAIHQRKEHIDDVERYIEQTLSRPAYSEWSAGTKELATRELLSKSQGMFLWVHLQLQGLRHCNPIDVEHALTKLPASLDATYERILKTISSNKIAAERIRRIFECLAFRRPGHSLHAEALSEVLAIDFDSSDGATLRPELRPKNPVASLLDSCSGLLHIVVDNYSSTFRRSDVRLQFIHFTVQEYLLSDSLPGDLRSFALRPESSHATLAQACLAAVASSDSHSPLTTYGTTCLGWHASHCPENADVERSLSQILLPANFERSNLHHYPSTYTQPLCWAASEGLVKHVEFLLDLDGTDINANGCPKGTALCAAAYHDRLETVKLLVSRGAAISAEAEGGDGPPLHLAAMRDNDEVISFLLDQGAHVSARDSYGMIALHKAASQDNSDSTIMLLLGRGSNVDAVDNRGQTPLHVASRYACTSSARILLEHGAAVDARDERGCTALHHAFGSLRTAENLVSLLLEHGASLGSYDEGGNTPLHVAARWDCAEEIHTLLKHGAKVNVPNRHGQSPLQLAAINGNVRAVCLLSEWGASPRTSLPAGWTVLHEAASKHIDVYKLGSPFLSKLALQYPKSGMELELEARADCGQTALSIASAAARYRNIRCLIISGANINMADSNGFRAIDYAAARGHADVMRLLLAHGADGWTESGPYGTYMDIARRTHRADELTPGEWQRLDMGYFAKWESENKFRAWERRSREFIGRYHWQYADLSRFIAEKQFTAPRGDRMMRRVRRYRSLICLPESERPGAPIPTIDDLKEANSRIASALNALSGYRTRKSDPTSRVQEQAVDVVEHRFFGRG